MSTRRSRLGAAALLGLIGVLVAAGAPPRPGYPEAPPPAHTGGFGEPTCQACHFDAEVNDPGGALAVQGVPGTYTPGERYRLVVALRRAEMERGGFQLAARYADGKRAGKQAGTLRAADERAEATTGSGTGVQYAHHTRAGTALASPDSTGWILEWTAPDEATGPVVFHVSANAANGDDSQFGDWVYADSAVSRPGRK